MNSLNFSLRLARSRIERASLSLFSCYSVVTQTFGCDDQLRLEAGIARRFNSQIPIALFSGVETAGGARL